MKKIITIISLIAIILVGGYTVYYSQNNIKLSDLALANIEAIAGNDELPEVDITCNGAKNSPPGRCWILYGECTMGMIRFDDCIFSGDTSHSCLTPCD